LKVQLSKNVFHGIEWLTKHRGKPDPASVTLAVQTLRNTNFVAIFVGGYSLQSAVQTLNSFEKSASIPSKVRAIVLGITLICSFLAFASCIRSSSHLAYFVGALEYHDKAAEEERAANMEGNVANGEISSEAHEKNAARIEDESEDVWEEIKSMMRLLLISFNLGFRFLFISIPYSFYAVGPIALIISTSVVLLFLMSLDHFDFLNHDNPL
jgi:uncharacterized membrane protein